MDGNCHLNIQVWEDVLRERAEVTRRRGAKARAASGILGASPQVLVRNGKNKSMTSEARSRTSCDASTPLNRAKSLITVSQPETRARPTVRIVG